MQLIRNQVYLEASLKERSELTVSVLIITILYLTSCNTTSAQIGNDESSLQSKLIELNQQRPATANVTSATTIRQPINTELSDKTTTQLSNEPTTTTARRTSTTDRPEASSREQSDNTEGRRSSLASDGSGRPHVPAANSAIAAQTKDQPLQQPPRGAPVLRPSIEEEASELSRKYLNLERHKHLASSTTVSASGNSQKMTVITTTEKTNNLSTGSVETLAGTAMFSDDAEQEIILKPAQVVGANESHPIAREADTTAARSRLTPIGVSGNIAIAATANTNSNNDAQYLQIDNVASSVQRPSSSQITDATTSSKRPVSSRRQKNSHKQQRLARLQQGQQSSSNGDSELVQCQQYLQQHSTAYQALVNSAQTDPFLMVNKFSHSASQLLPCSCQQTSWHFASQSDPYETIMNIDQSNIWLNCDRIQLIGSQLFTPKPLEGSSSTVNNSGSFERRVHLEDGGPNEANENGDNGLSGRLTRFSQRDAGLQIIFPQKFHYLQLSDLKSIDMSQNRLRQIKMDAFHGLENTLEFLNLAHNLLGDSRAMFADATSERKPANAREGERGGNGAGDNSHQPPEERSTSSHSFNAHQSSQLIFIGDELNRLKKLKWLSLQNNQINQLGPSVFYQTQTSQHQFYHNQHHHDLHHLEPKRTPSELLYLDLSDNLLKSVPSGAIQFLDKLLVLSLKNNRIIHIDQTSRFPQALKYLDLSENLISTIHQSDLIDLPNLIELNLSNNQLRHLDQTAFVSANSRVAPPGTASFIQTPQQAVDEPSDTNKHDQSRLLPNAAKLGEQSALSSELYHSSETVAMHPRHRREVTGAQDVDKSSDLSREILEAEESGNIGSSSELDPSDDLETDESIFSAIASRLQGNAQQVISEEQNTVKPPSQFNSTLKLNLSHNFFENIPGDSLLKFGKLQSLDLSYNRIRRLDSNYICSIYNLVENLQYLDLGGNLLSLNQNTVSGDDNQKHLNKLFGCLQRLEKLLLSTNRLASAVSTQRLNVVVTDNQPVEIQPITSRDEPDFDFIQTEESQQNANRREDKDSSRPAIENARLIIKFGDNHGNRQLNTLDLSDNQLKLFPLITLAAQPTIVAPSSTSTSNANNSANNQAQLNQWMNSRLRLGELNLSYNYLERLDSGDFEHLYNLRNFNLDFNKLTALPAKIMKRFTSLEDLSLAGNRIGSLEPFHQLFERSQRTLKRLNLANNRLMTWPASTNSPSSSQSSNYNPDYRSSSGPTGHDMGLMTEYDVSGSSKRQPMPTDLVIEELNLEGNLLTSINVTSLFDQLIYMKSLKNLNLSYNLLNKVQSEWFKFANKNLQRLLLTGNKINSIDLGAFALNQVNELIQLNLDYNSLKELKRKTFESMPKIRELSLAHNLIHTINSETFHQLNSLQVLRLNNNKLTSWKCEYFSHLCNSISGNINVDLATLISSHHQKYEQELAPSQLSISEFASSGQQQPAAANSAVSSLIELDLSHNSISQLRANSISVHTKLTRLDLSHNKLSFIPHDLFKATTSILGGGRQIHLVSSLKYLNLAHNRIQTIDNINFKPLKNLFSLDLSFNELQSLGVDVITLEAHNSKQESATRRVFVSNNLTSLLLDNDTPPDHQQERNRTSRSARSLYSTSSWPALSKLRYLNLSHNTLSLLNQSLLSELSPFVSLNLDLSYNYLDSDMLPVGFFTKVTSSSNLATRNGDTVRQQGQHAQTDVRQPPSEAPPKSNYDLIFTLKIESIDLSHNRLSEWPGALLENHYSSMESCNLSHNRIQNLPQNSNPMIQMKSLNLEFNPLSRDASEMMLGEQKSARYLNLAATRLYAIQQATAEGVQYSSSLPNHKMRLVNQTSQLDLIRSISKPIEGPYLKHLNLSSNQLVWLAASVFDRMHSLQTLDLSNNQLTRLHLLSNQLNQVSTSLEYLHLGSNLFTSIDPTDFNHLSRIRHLDLSNLLSLQKLNCRFLSKLSTLRRLMMFNYPQLRQRLNNIVANLYSTKDHHLVTSERYQMKLQDELVMSTIGGHCFQDTSKIPLSSSESPIEFEKNWYKLEQIELELFNNFQQSDKKSRSQGSFHLTDELRQLLGPRTTKLSVIGLNLTSIDDGSLLGITSDHFDLKISYTSISHVPLRQILTSLARQTRLKLDLRNNNIQSIDMEALQWLDELQQINQVNFDDNSFKTIALDPESGSSLRLASNPFRCDCQTRPLWLWLNQRWDNIDEFSQVPDDQIGETSIGNSANYWLKFQTISQASDIKCFYPAKLRGRLAQHVYYNDLVCKSPASSQGSSGTSIRSKKRNETTRASDSYYLTSQGDLSDLDDLDDEDYSEMHNAGTNPIMYDPVVKVTRFNRYPSATSNSTSIYFLNNFPTIPLIPERSELPASDDGLEASNRIGKRDQHGLRGSSIDASSGLNHVFGNPQGPVINTKYSRYKPNTQQKHSPYETMSSLNSVKFGRSSGGQHIGRQSILTESDVMILTAASIAMTVMSFVIMAVCLFKYKMDRTDEEQILSTHSKLVMSRALFTNRTDISSEHSLSQSSSLSSSHDRTPSDHTKRTFTKSKTGSTSNRQHEQGGAPSKSNDQPKTHGAKIMQSETSDHKIYYNALASATHPMSSYLSKPQDLPGQQANFLAPVTQNFLMRSPTLRKMHGLAGNASDWFKYTLRAYPSASGTRRRRLFIQNNAVCGGPSQLSTSRPDELQQDPHQLAMSAAARASNVSTSLQSGCPNHGLKILSETTSRTDDCIHCARLLLRLKQNKFVSTFRQTDRLAGVKSNPTNDSDLKPNDLVISETSKELASNHQQVKNGLGGAATFQTIIEQSGGFMPPKMIQALAQRLDEQASTCKSGTRPAPYSRDQQVKAMRTFGHKYNNLPRSGASMNESLTTTTSTGNGVPSQIPTIDVDGRFAYQSDSNVDSHTDYDIRSDARGGVTPASTVATNQDDIFILVRDSPTGDTVRESLNSCREGGTQARNQAADGTETGSQVTTMTNDGRSSMMNDECSRSSSPIAYGFMRSSPSITTQSSATLTSNNHRNSYLVDRAHESVTFHADQNFRAALSKTTEKQPQSLTANQSKFCRSSATENPGRHQQKSSGFAGGSLDDNNNNDSNNNNNYVNSRLFKSQVGDSATRTAPEKRSGVRTFQNGSFGQPRPAEGTSDGNEDQLIISRL